MSPFSAVGLLSMHVRGRIAMTRETYDKAFDAITSLLEEANDNQYRLRDTIPAPEPKDEK